MFGFFSYLLLSTHFTLLLVHVMFINLPPGWTFCLQLWRLCVVLRTKSRGISKTEAPWVKASKDTGRPCWPDSTKRQSGCTILVYNTGYKEDQEITDRREKCRRLRMSLLIMFMSFDEKSFPGRSWPERSQRQRSERYRWSMPSKMSYCFHLQ